jgi:hypothetical protein
VVEMRILRSAVLAIVASFALLAGIATTANADDGAAVPAWDVLTLPAEAPGASLVAIDPGDPGFPPDSLLPPLLQ